MEPTQESLSLVDLLKWAIGVVGMFVVGIYTDLRARIKGNAKLLADALPRHEFDDYKEERLRRDDEVQSKLDKIDTSIGRVHARIDELLTRRGP